MTYIDSGVLIAAARGVNELSKWALAFLGDPGREYISSDFVKLEVLPQATFHHRQAEVDFYNSFFDTVSRSIPASDTLLSYALHEASAKGIQGMDAIHIACAAFAGAEELITSEKSTSTIHRTDKVKVVSILPIQST